MEDSTKQFLLGVADAVRELEVANDSIVELSGKYESALDALAQIRKCHDLSCIHEIARRFAGL